MSQLGRVFLLTGKVASGKTTYARQFEKEGGAVLLSLDELQLSIFGSNPTREQLDQSYEGASAYQRELAVKLLHLGVDVYIDWGFWTKTDRIQARRFFGEAGYKVEVIYFDIPESERRVRNRKRNSGNDVQSFKIEEKDLSMFDSYFEIPEINEYDRLITD